MNASPWTTFEQDLGLPAPASGRRHRITHHDCKGPAGMELIRRAQDGDDALLDAIVRANEGFILKEAGHFTYKYKRFADDLRNEARDGFRRAITGRYKCDDEIIQSTDRFDPDRGFELTTYSASWIRHYCGRFLANHSRTIRIPVHALDALTAALKAGATTAAEASAMSTSRVLKDAWNQRAGTLSLDMKIEADGSATTFKDVIPDVDTPSPEEEAVSADHAARLRRLVARALRRLTPMERDVAVRRFMDRGADPSGTDTLKQIGDSHGLSRERIRQIEAVAKNKLRVLLSGARGE